MLAPKPFRLFALLIASILLLAACGGQPSAPVPTAAPTNVPTTTPEPTATPAPTDTPEPTATPVPTATPEPTAVPISDPITGAPGLARGILTQRPYIAMIDNHPDAYPQSGLDHAAVVFEALAEFGVTRFMAVFAPGITPDAKQIGPIRSTRLYFAEWAMGFHAVYAHAGGSPEGLSLAESTDQLIDLDALQEASTNYYWRSSQRVAPHNLYTSSAELARATQNHNSSNPDLSDLGFIFKYDAPAAERPAAQSLTYYFIYKEDSAGWTYDPATNGYLRLRRNSPARDAVSGKQLWTKNVIVMEVSEAPIAGDGKGRIEQDIIGSGRARVFLDGIEREITWEKDAAAAPLHFYDDANTETTFNAGPVWIAVVPSLDNLTVI